MAHVFTVARSEMLRLAQALKVDPDFSSGPSAAFDALWGRLITVPSSMSSERSLPSDGGKLAGYASFGLNRHQSFSRTPTLGVRNGVVGSAGGGDRPRAVNDCVPAQVVRSVHSCLHYWLDVGIDVGCLCSLCSVLNSVLSHSYRVKLLCLGYILLKQSLFIME